MAPLFASSPVFCRLHDSAIANTASSRVRFFYVLLLEREGGTMMVKGRLIHVAHVVWYVGRIHCQ